MRKYFFNAIAIIIAIVGMSLKEPVQKRVTDKKSPIEICFKFVGTKNSQEGDRTKWEQVTVTVCVALQCNKARFGCKLKATATVIISGIVRPKSIYLLPGTNDPTTGADVSEVSNADD